MDFTGNEGILDWHFLKAHVYIYLYIRLLSS